MNQTPSQTTNESPAQPPHIFWAASGIASGAYLLELFVVLARPKLPGAPNWTEAVLLLTATLAMVISLQRRLPLQNVLLAAGIIAFVGSLAHGICTVTSIPFGPMTFTAAGPPIVGDLSWAIPFLWITAVLTSRGVARLILRPWRKLRTYGFWWIGLTAFLTALLDFALEPFATQFKHFWVWRETRFPLTWYGMPLTNTIGWLVTTLLLLAFATPALINKQPRSRHSPPDYSPLIAWVSAMLLFATGAATQSLWPVVAVCSTSAIVVTSFAIRGARW